MLYQVKVEREYSLAELKKTDNICSILQQQAKHQNEWQVK